MIIVYDLFYFEAISEKMSDMCESTILLKPLLFSLTVTFQFQYMFKLH